MYLLKIQSKLFGNCNVILIDLTCVPLIEKVVYNTKKYLLVICVMLYVKLAWQENSVLAVDTDVLIDLPYQI